MTEQRYFIEGARDQQECNPKLHTGCYLLPSKAVEPFSREDFLSAMQMMILPGLFIALLVWNWNKKK